MKKHFLIILFFNSAISLIILSCNNSNNNKKKITPSLVDTDTVAIKLPHSKTETGMEYINPEDIGVLLNTVDFKVKATSKELEIFKEGIVPWISLEEPLKEIDRLIDPDKTVLSDNKVILIIDYPVMTPVYIPLVSEGTGFSRRQLITAISRQYHAMFKEEEETSATKTVPLDKREGIINRNQTNGKYGIWGHDLSDLDLSSIEIYKNKNGIVYLSLGIES